MVLLKNINILSFVNDFCSAKYYRYITSKFAIKCHNNAKLSAWFYSLLDPISEDVTFDMFWSIFLYFMCISIFHSLIKYAGVEFLQNI